MARKETYAETFDRLDREWQERETARLNRHNERMRLIQKIHEHEIRAEVLEEVALAAHEDSEGWIRLWSERELAEAKALEEEYRKQL